mmetsp:Transcript_145530/g.465076  ORF Transcript_145530/g.465076 Transcript_145530/m.465076 type:complete len:147 (+) Transcript_145530:112-552(+)
MHVASVIRRRFPGLLPVLLVASAGLAIAGRWLPAAAAGPDFAGSAARASTLEALASELCGKVGLACASRHFELASKEAKRSVDRSVQTALRELGVEREIRKFQAFYAFFILWMVFLSVLLMVTLQKVRALEQSLVAQRDGSPLQGR